MNKKRAVKIISSLLALLIIVFAGFYVASDFGRMPLFFLSRNTVSEMETTNYTGGACAKLSPREVRVMTAKLSELKLSRVYKDEKEIIGAQNPFILSVKLRPFGALKIIFINEITDYFDYSKNRQLISINGRIYESAEGYDYSLFEALLDLGNIRSVGHPEEFSNS